VNALHLIHKWSIEHAYVVIAFYVAMMGLAWITISQSIPRRFAPYVESPMIGIVTMMPGLSAQEMELYVSNPIEQQMVNIRACDISVQPPRAGSRSSRWSFLTARTSRNLWLTSRR